MALVRLIRRGANRPQYVFDAIVVSDGLKCWNTITDTGGRASLGYGYAGLAVKNSTVPASGSQAVDDQPHQRGHAVSPAAWISPGAANQPCSFLNFRQE